MQMEIRNQCIGTRMGRRDRRGGRVEGDLSGALDTNRGGRGKGGEDYSRLGKG